MSTRKFRDKHTCQSKSTCCGDETFYLGRVKNITKCTLSQSYLFPPLLLFLTQQESKEVIASSPQLCAWWRAQRLTLQSMVWLLKVQCLGICQESTKCLSYQRLGHILAHRVVKWMGGKWDDKRNKKCYVIEEFFQSLYKYVQHNVSCKIN